VNALVIQPRYAKIESLELGEKRKGLGGNICKDFDCFTDRLAGVVTKLLLKT